MAEKTQPRAIRSPRSIPAFLFLLGALSVSSLAAQQFTTLPSEPIDLNPDIPTLHVYSTHLQTSALVLDQNRRPASIAPDDFLLSLDHGSPFTPLDVHLEDGDPLSLAVLIDLTSDHKLLSRLPDAIGTLREVSLRSQDQVSLFAVDCSVERFAGDTSTPDSLTQGIQSLLHNPALHPPGHPKGTCADSLKLWDAAAAALGIMSTTPGRHVLLIVTPGAEVSSQVTLPVLTEIAHRTAAAIFVLPDSASLAFTGLETPEARTARIKQASDLALLAENTGGIALAPLTGDSRLNSFIALLRSRYVLEFARPKSFSNDRTHLIEATLQHHELPVLLTGTSAPVTNDQQRRDPSTVSYDGSAGAAVGHNVGQEQGKEPPSDPVPAPSSISSVRLGSPELTLDSSSEVSHEAPAARPASSNALIPCVEAEVQDGAIRFVTTCSQPQRVLLYDTPTAQPQQIDLDPGKPVTRPLTQPADANYFACPSHAHPVDVQGRPVQPTDHNYGCEPDSPTP